MGVADLPRTLWIAVAIAVGLAHGAVREWSGAADPLDDYPVLLTDQRQFEHALVAERHGHRLFQDVTVYPHWARDPATGRKRLLHLVTGAYWDGRAEAGDGGALQARWSPACFVAPTPYEPLTTPGGPGDGSASGRFDSVLDYLAAVRAARGTPYRYAWWWWTSRPAFTSTLVSVVLIGGVLPTALNLVAFGRLTRPPRERRPSLWAVRIRRRQKPTPAVAPVHPAHDDAVEVSAAAPDPKPVAQVAPRPLPVEAVAVPAAEAHDKHFGARKEDFYPTELRAAPPHDTSYRTEARITRW